MRKSWAWWRRERREISGPGRFPPPGPGIARAAAVEAIRADDPLLPLPEVEVLVEEQAGRHSEHGPISRYLADDTVTEIMINGPGPVWIERNGELSVTGTELGRYDIDLLVERIVVPLGLRIDRTSPIVDARLTDGSRVNVVAPPLAVDGPAVSIRRFPSRTVPLAAFGPPDMVGQLEELMARRASIVVVGQTSSGKTTLINTLAALFEPTERVITIEDTAELRLAGGTVVRLEARPANSEGVGAVSMRQLVLNALRMRPDRLVVGEVRGAEAFDLLLALTSGHRGALTSCHAEHAAAGLRRLEILASLAGAPMGHRLPELVADGLDAVVTTARSGGGGRIVSSIDQLEGGELVNCWSAQDRRLWLSPPPGRAKSA